MQTKHLTGTVKAVDTDDKNGSFEVILSTPTLDRDGEIVDAGAFEPLPDHITFDIDHGLSVATTVGSGVPRYEDGALKVSGTYSSIPRAQEVRTLVAEGHIRTTSVAYLHAKTETKAGVPHIVKADLLNGAFVPVPANRDAVIVAAKSHTTDREQITAAIQAADALTGNQVIGLVVRHVVDGAAPVDVIEIVQPAQPMEDAVDTKTPDDTPKVDTAAPATVSPAAAGARARRTAIEAEADLLVID